MTNKPRNTLFDFLLVPIFCAFIYLVLSIGFDTGKEEMEVSTLISAFVAGMLTVSAVWVWLRERKK